MPDIKTHYYTFYQNNSGGSFVFSKQDGVAEYVIIEACDVGHAVSRAEDIGIYFEGCSGGRDCDCCGDRWSRPWKDDASEFPEVYGDNPRKNAHGDSVVIHNLDGTREWYTR